MFYKLINLVKLNYNLKKKKFNTDLNKNDFNIIKLFIQLNIIKLVKKKKNYNFKFVVYLNYVKNKPVFRNIKNLHRSSMPLYINLKQLLKVNKKKNNIYILSTNKGLINNFEAEKNKIGGVMICWIRI